jgi:hypothetical protein
MIIDCMSINPMNHFSSSLLYEELWWQSLGTFC